MLHAKHLSIDEDVAIIGSSNFDIRPQPAHGGDGLGARAGVRGRDARIEDDYRANSRLLTLEEWLRRPRREQVFDNLMRLTSALM